MLLVLERRVYDFAIVLQVLQDHSIWQKRKQMLQQGVLNSILHHLLKIQPTFLSSELSTNLRQDPMINNGDFKALAAADSCYISNQKRYQ